MNPVSYEEMDEWWDYGDYDKYNLGKYHRCYLNMLTSLMDELEEAVEGLEEEFVHQKEDSIRSMKNTDNALEKVEQEYLYLTGVSESFNSEQIKIDKETGHNSKRPPEKLKSLLTKCSIFQIALSCFASTFQEERKLEPHSRPPEHIPLHGRTPGTRQ